MVHDSLNGHEDGEESALGELEELSEQMEALESDETEFEAKEEFEDALEKEEIGSEAIAALKVIFFACGAPRIRRESYLLFITIELFRKLRMSG